MWKLMAITVAIFLICVVVLYLFSYLVIMAVKRLKERKCGLHICAICNVKEMRDWKYNK